MGNGQGLSITSIGSTKFLSPTNPHITLSLNNLLLVPSITKNLVSVSKFANDNKVFFEFHSICCFVKCQVSKQILLEGHLDSEGLYCFKQLQFLPSPSICHPVVNTTVTSNNSDAAAAADDQNSFSTFTMWHRRLGHTHAHAIKTVLELCKVPYQNKTVRFL